MKRHWPIAVILIFFLILFKDFFFRGFIPVPADTLVGAYYPWLDYKWGYPVGVPVKNPIISDVFSQFFIWKHLSTDLLKQGVMPFWDPYSFSGTPFLATFHSTVLSPWNIFFLLPKYSGWGMNIFASFLFAAVSMYFYLSLFVRRPLARLAGSVVFALAGPMTTWGEFGTAVWAAGCLPLIFLSLEMILTYRRLRFAFLLTAAVVLLILSGHAQLLTYAFVLAPFYVLLRRPPSRTILLIVLAFAAGVILTAIQLIPTADFLTRSIRAEEKFSQSYNYGLVPASQLVRLWMPDFFGHPATGNTWGGFDYHEYSAFLGTLVLPLVFASFFLPASFIRKFFSVVFISSLVLVVDSPLSRLIFSLPLPLFTYSYASRLFFLTGLSASVLCAVFLDSPRWRPVAVASFFLLSLTGLALVLAPASFRHIALKNSLLPVFQLLVLIAFIFISRFRRFLVPALLVFLLFDLGRYFVKFTPFVPSRLVFPTTPVISFLTDQPGLFRIARESAALLPPNTWAMYHLENIEGYDPLSLNSYSHFFHDVNRQPYADTSGRFSQLTDFRPRFLDALDVKYILEVKPTSDKNLPPIPSEIRKNNYPLVFSDGHVNVYQNPTALPRAYFVSRVVTATPEAQLASFLDRSDFDPTKTAIVPVAAPVTSGTVSDIVSRPNFYSLTAAATSSGLLVMANAYDPGWTAAVDGRPIPVYRTDGGLQSIVFPGGTHRVVFTYQPPYFDLAFAITLSAWVGVTICFFVSRPKIV